VVRFYSKRGTAKQWIKEGKQAMKMARLSYHRFRSNEVRLGLSVMAYNLGNLWRRLTQLNRDGPQPSRMPTGDSPEIRIGGILRSSQTSYCRTKDATKKRSFPFGLPHPAVSSRWSCL
jgi:hypothetical protein